jgi:hypothetical protein
MVFRPLPFPSRWEGLIAAVWIVLIDLLLLVWVVRRPVDLLKFILIFVIVASLPVLAQLLHRTWIAFTLEYWVDRNSLTIRWANARAVIPLSAIRRIVLDEPMPRFNWFWHWPTPNVRTLATVQNIPLHLCANHRADECLFVDTGDALYCLTPADMTGFLDTLQERYQMGEAGIVPASTSRRLWLDRWLPPDRKGAWLLGGGLAGVLLIFGILMISFPDLADVLTVRYNSAGLPEEIREKSVLFRLPAISLLVWLANAAAGTLLIANRQRVGAYMLWAGAIVVDLFMLLAVVSLIA